MKISKNIFLLSLGAISSISALSSVVFLNTNINNNNQVLENNNQALQLNSATNVSQIDVNHNKVLKTSFSPLFSQGSSTISVTSRGMVGYDSNLKKLVLTSFDGKKLWKSDLLYSGELNPNSNITISSIAYNDTIDQIGVLFSINISNNTDKLYLNVFNAQTGRAIKSAIEIANPYNHKYFKLNSSINDASFLIYPVDFALKNAITVLTTLGLTYDVRLYNDSFVANHIESNSNNKLNGRDIEDQRKNNEKISILQRYVSRENNRTFYFMLSYMNTSNNQNTYYLSVFDNHFNYFKNNSLTLGAVSNNRSKAFEKMSNSFMFSKENDNLRTSFIINQNQQLIIGSAKINLRQQSATAWTNNDHDIYVYQGDNNNYFNINNYYIDNRNGAFVGISYLKSNNSSIANDKKGKSIFLIKKNNLSNLKTVSDLQSFVKKIKLYKLDSSENKDSYNNAEAVGYFNGKIYYSLLENNQGKLKVINDNFQLAWNTDFVKDQNNHLVCKIDNYYTTLSNEKLAELLLSKLNQVVVNNNNQVATIIKIKNVENLNDQHSDLIINHTLDNQVARVTYSIQNFYQNGQYITTAQDKQINVNFVYNKLNLPRLENVSINLKNENNSLIQNVTYAQKVKITAEVIKTNNITENDLTYTWWFKAKGSNDFVMLEQKSRELQIDSFKNINEGTYKVAVAYNKLLKNDDNPVIVFTSEKTVHLLDDSIPRLNSVTVIPTNGTTINFDDTLKLRFNKDFQHVDPSTLSYQWYFNDVALQGQTNETLNIEHFTIRNVGEYYVRITSTQENLEVKSIKSNPVNITIQQNTSNEIRNFHIFLKEIDIYNNPISFEKRDNIYQVETNNEVIGFLNVIYDVSSDKNDKLKYKFGEINPVTGNFIGTNIDQGSYVKNQRILVPFNQTGLKVYRFEFWIDGIENSLVSANISINFEKRVNVDPNNPILVNVENINNIPSGSNVVLTYSNNLSDNFSSFKWYYYDESAKTDIEITDGSSVEGHNISLQLKNYNWRNNGLYRLKGVLKNDHNEEIEVELQSIVLKSKPQVLIKSNMNYNYFGSTLASAVDKGFLESLLEVDVDQNEYLVLYDYIVDDFEGVLLIVPKIIERNSGDEIFKLNSIQIDGFMQLKWIVIGVTLAAIAAIVLIILIILSVKKKTKYNLDKVILNDRIFWVYGSNRSLSSKQPTILPRPNIAVPIQNQSAQSNNTLSKSNSVVPNKSPAVRPDNILPRPKTVVVSSNTNIINPSNEQRNLNAATSVKSVQIKKPEKDQKA